VYKTLITDLELSTTLPMNGCRNDDMIKLDPLRSQSLFQFVQITDAYFCTSLAIVLTCCNQSDSNLANLEATVEVLEFFLLQLNGSTYTMSMSSFTK